MTHTFRIATRKSPLALWQARTVAQRLRTLHPELRVELVRMTTQGDRILDSPLAKIGGKGLFVKELELGLLDGRADLAVHSMKDVPMIFPQGLHLPVILQREDPRDALVSTAFGSLADLPDDARIGTSSLRRQCQLRARRPSLKVSDLRGNVNTRLAKLDAGDYDAIILACAGLKRLDLETRITELLPVSECLPAIGQGAIGIECRVDDHRIRELISPLDHIETQTCVRAERAINSRLGGGCQVPIAGFAELQEDKMYLQGLVGYPDGRSVIHTQRSGAASDPEGLGHAVAEDLLARGADEILAKLGVHVPH